MKIYILKYHFFDTISKEEMYFTKHYTSKKKMEEKIKSFECAISTVHYEMDVVEAE